MSRLQFTPALATCSMALLLACGGKEADTGGSDRSTSHCNVPLAEAGSPQTLPLGSQIRLDGSRSQWCSSYSGAEITYSWSFEHVPANSNVDDNALSDNRSETAANPSFVPDLPGEYVVSLRINDPSTASTPDYVVVNITSSDVPPTASCGGDVNGKVGVAAQLDGGESSDPEGAALSYDWSISSTPECSALADVSIFDQGTAVASIIPDCQGLYVVSLIVSDGLQASEPAFCSLNANSDNAPPVAESGMGGLLPPCTENPFRLSGWESYDPDGDTLSYSWSVVSTPRGADAEIYGFDDSETVGPYFTWDKPGDWSFQLQVDDGTQTSAPDIVTYTVGGIDTNNSPTAIAGADQTISVTTTCTVGDDGPECEPCPESRLSLDGTASSDPDGDGLNYLWSETTDALSWSSDTSALPELIFPEMDIEPGDVHTFEYTVSLDVSDCSLSDDDHITVTYTCRSE